VRIPAVVRPRFLKFRYPGTFAATAGEVALRYRILGLPRQWSAARGEIERLEHGLEPGRAFFAARPWFQVHTVNGVSPMYLAADAEGAVAIQEAFIEHGVM